MNNPNQLHIFMLGTPYLQWNNKTLDISRRQVRALLYRLAADPLPVSRDHLCYLFWSDETQSMARRRLTHLQSHLQDALPISELLVSTNDTISLNHNVVWSDVTAFEQLSKSVQDPTPQDICLEVRQLYRGAFLEGFTPGNLEIYQDWMRQQQVKHERKYLALLEKLIDHFYEIHAYDDAIKCSQVYLETDELAEHIHRRLIEFYVLIGNHNTARRQLETCEALIQRELGQPLLPETVAVLQPVVAKQRASIHSSNVSPARTDNMPLVGREAELNKLYELYNQAKSGHGSVCFVSGEAGIGKTRLVSEFLSGLQGEVLQGYCYAGTQQMPYYPVLNSPAWTETLATGTHDTMVDRLADMYRSKTFLSLQDVPDSTRLQMLVNPILAQACLQQVANGDIFIMSLEDIEWADEATLGWLTYFGLMARNSRVLILCTHCCSPTQRLLDWQNKLRHTEIQLDNIILSGLCRNAARQLLHILPNASDILQDHLLEKLWGTTGGNPFYLLEIGAALSRNDRGIQHRKNLTEALPESVNHAIDVRLADLSPHARHTLEAAAMLTTPFSLDDLSHLTGQTAVQVVDALEELVDRYLLREQGIYYQFRHEIIRRRVQHQTKPTRQELLQRQLKHLRRSFHATIKPQSNLAYD